MPDKIQTAYHDSINVYDNVLTQRKDFQVTVIMESDMVQMDLHDDCSRACFLS